MAPVVCFCAGNAEAQYLQGMGVARQRQAIVNGLRDSIKHFASDITDVSSRDVIEMVCPSGSAHCPFHCMLKRYQNSPNAAPVCWLSGPLTAKDKSHPEGWALRR